jgi:hypothetical protein
MGTNQSNQLGFDTLVEVCVDVVATGRDIQAAASDGIQFTDAFVIVQDFGKIDYVGKHAAQALAELKDLTPDEADQAQSIIAQRTGLPDDASLMGKVRKSLRLAARTYRLATDAVDLVHAWKDEVFS